MSEDFVPAKQITADDLFDGRLEKLGVREHITPGETRRDKLKAQADALRTWATEEMGFSFKAKPSDSVRDRLHVEVDELPDWATDELDLWLDEGDDRCLTDGDNYLDIYVNGAGFVECMTRWGINDPEKILSAIAEAFDTDIWSENQPQFWGFNTVEEWDSAIAKAAEESRERLYLDLVEYAQEKPNGILAGTSNMIRAEIAKRLAKTDPTFLSRDNKESFLREIDEIYYRDHANRDKVSDEDPPF